jgi:hypothetical protein
LTSFLLKSTFAEIPFAATRSAHDFQVLVHVRATRVPAPAPFKSAFAEWFTLHIGIRRHRTIDSTKEVCVCRQHCFNNNPEEPILFFFAA